MEKEAHLKIFLFIASGDNLDSKTQYELESQPQ